MTALPSADGERLYVSGMTPSHTRVLDARTGEVVANLEDRGLYDLSATADDQLFLAESGGTVVLDGTTFEERYTRTEWADGASLVHLPSLYHYGDAPAVREALLTAGGISLPLDGWAPLLYDPRRVLAGAAGVEVLPPSLPPAPEITSRSPEGRTVTLPSAPGAVLTLQVTARDERAMLGFLVERDGTAVAHLAEGDDVELDEGGRQAHLQLTVRLEVGATTDLHIRPIARSGVLGRPDRLTVRSD